MLFLIPYCDAYAPVILLYFGPFMLTLGAYITFVLCGYHVPGPTRLGKMSKPLLPSRLRFWKPASQSSCPFFFCPTFLFNFFFCIVYVTQTPQIAHEQYRVRATTSYSYEYENEHMVIVQVHECEYHCCCTRTSFGRNHQHTYLLHTNTSTMLEQCLLICGKKSLQTLRTGMRIYMPPKKTPLMRPRSKYFV